LRSLFGGDELAGAREILRLGPKVVVVTMGADGCLVVTNDEAIRLPAYTVPVADTTGAGDCFIGTFVSLYLQNWNLRQCGTYASAAAAISVTKVGSRSALPTLDEIEHFLAKSGESGKGV
jgi:sugar/nucleoside kinase (ribokinase family)